MASSPQFCGHCGAANRSQARFCKECGSSLPATASVGAIATTVDNSKQTANDPAVTMKGSVLPTNSVLAGRYTIQRLLGQGGMGTVYLAADQRFGGALRAIKELLQEGLTTREQQEATQSFEHEALLLARLSHPNLPRIYDHFQEQGRWYLAMDYIEGATLEERLDKLPGHHFTIEKSVMIALQLCSVLHYLHIQSPPVIFRDLKPANIMLTGEEHVYLIDFGIARFFKPGQAVDTMALGSPGYAAPEQYGRTQTTARSDIYSLGATLHRMLTGHDPANDPFQFSPLGLPPTSANKALEQLVLQMVEMKKEQRPASVQEVKQRLQVITSQLHEQPQQAGAKAARTTAKYPAIPPASTKNHHAPAQPAQPAPKPIELPSPSSAQVRPPGTAIPANEQSNSLRPTALLVDRAGSGQYTSINEAIRNAVPHERILVKPGRYQECLILDKPVEILGSGEREQIIIETFNNNCLVMRADVATIRGVTFYGRNGNTTPPAGENTFLNMVGELVIGAAQRGKPGENKFLNTMADIVRGFSQRPGNGVNNQPYTIYVPQGQLTLEECDIRGEASDGVAVEGNSACAILRKCVVHNGISAGVVALHKGQAILENCTLHHHEDAGLIIKGAGSLAIAKHCTFYEGKNAGIFLYDGGHCLLEECSIYKHRKPGIAVKDAGSQATIRQCKIYDCPSNGVRIYESGQATLEDCQIINNTGPNVVIDQGGNATIQRCQIANGREYGVWLLAGGQGVLEGCTISGHSAANVYITDASVATLKQCTIYDGPMQGVHITEQAQATISHCEIHHQRQPGIVLDGNSTLKLRKTRVHNCSDHGLYIGKGSVSVSECEIYQNTGSGVYIASGGNPTVHECLIHDCHLYGVHVEDGGAGMIEHCDLRGNGRGAKHARFASPARFYDNKR